MTAEQIALLRLEIATDPEHRGYSDQPADMILLMLHESYSKFVSDTTKIDSAMGIVVSEHPDFEGDEAPDGLVLMRPRLEQLLGIGTTISLEHLDEVLDTMGEVSDGGQ